MEKISRRTFVAGTIALPLLVPALSSAISKTRVIVIGAGAFGGWTALHLLRNGADVTLVDAWGAGNSRASSGGETRVIRGVYGPTQIYTQWTVRSLQLWMDAEKAWKRKLFYKTNAIWMVRGDDSYEKAALPLLKAEGLPYQSLTLDEASRLYPQINFEGIQWVLKEEQAGFLLARQACQAVVDAFVSEGGDYRIASAKPGRRKTGLDGIDLSTGTSLQADYYVFACGPWLSEIFPNVAGGKLIQPTRQEVFFFGTPAGDERFTEKQLPVWIDHGDRLIYGVPGNERRGFKVADDTRGPHIDPTTQERVISQDQLDAIRKFVAVRFPLLKDAPLVESRVCQYENSPDQHFIIDRHPEMPNVWIIGGGSGHGFKHGPALGEYAASVILEKQKLNPFFQLSRLVKVQG